MSSSLEVPKQIMCSMHSSPTNNNNPQINGGINSVVDPDLDPQGHLFQDRKMFINEVPVLLTTSPVMLQFVELILTLNITGKNFTQINVILGWVSTVGTLPTYPLIGHREAVC